MADADVDMSRGGVKTSTGAEARGDAPRSRLERAGPTVVLVLDLRTCPGVPYRCGVTNISSSKRNTEL
jgi:hypothetical protein